MLTISLLAAAFSLIWCPVLAAWTNRWDLFLPAALGWPLAWFGYQSALQSAVAYGEQLRATFDLYRHHLLEALRRPLPADLHAERQEWKRLARFFFRNIPLPPPEPAPSPPAEKNITGGPPASSQQVNLYRDPDPPQKPDKSPRDPWVWLFWGVFLVIVPLVSLWMARKPTAIQWLPVPVRDLPAYYLITEGDLTTAPLFPRQVEGETIRDRGALVGRLTLEPLPAERPVRQDQVVAVSQPALIRDTIAVGIATDAAGILGGALRPGDVVMLAVVPSQETGTPATLFDAVLVLDVRPGGETNVVVVAIPAARWGDYLAASRSGRILLTRRVSP